MASINGIDALLFVLAALSLAWAMWERRERLWLHDEHVKLLIAHAALWQARDRRERAELVQGFAGSGEDTAPCFPAVEGPTP